MTAAATLTLRAPMANHPNRRKVNHAAGSNPTPAEIARAREAAGLTQDQAGRLLYGGWKTWQKWELGERRMHPADWELFNVKVRARALHLPPAELRRLGLHLPELDAD